MESVTESTQFAATKKLLLETTAATDIEVALAVAEGFPPIWNAVAWHDDLALEVAAGHDATHAIARLGIHMFCGQLCSWCSRPKVLYDCLSPVSTPPRIARPVDAMICGYVWSEGDGIYLRDCK